MRVFSLLCFTLLLALSVKGDWWERAGIKTRNTDGFALRFSANYPRNQYAQITKTISLGGTFSIEALLKPRLNWFGPVLDFTDNSGHRVLLTFDLDGTLLLFVTRVNKGVLFATTVQSDPRSPLSINQWNYIVVTVDQQGLVRFYNNYGSVSQYIGGGYLNFAIPTFFATTNSIGRIAEDYLFFHGDLDEIKIWSAVLPDNQRDYTRIIDLTPGQFADINLLAWWAFDEGIGLQAFDYSKNGNTVALGGGDLFRAPDWVFSSPIPTTLCKTTQCGGTFALRTFDKLWIDPFRGISNPFTPNLEATGDFWLSRSSPSLNGVPVLAVQVRLDQTQVAPTAIIGVALDYFGDQIWLDFNFVANNYASKIRIKQAGETSFTVYNVDAIYLPKSGITIVREGPAGSPHEFYVQVPFEESLHLEVDPRIRSQKVELSLKIPTEEFFSTVGPFLSGLCGNFNGNRNDDAITNVALDAVAYGASIFDGTYNFLNYTGSTGYICDVNALTPAFLAQANSICQNSTTVNPAFANTCLQAVCSSGSIDSAVPYALLTFDECKEAFINQQNETINTCVIPCPNFCSFHGTCSSNGTCLCSTGFGGHDCSQQANFSCYTARWAKAGVQYNINPFVGSPYKDIVSHYSFGYPNYYSANTGNEIGQSVVIYLYEQPGVSTTQTQLGLVLIADKALAGNGGSLSLTATFTNAPNVAIAVKDDPDDSYSLSNGIFHGVWQWWRCCTDGVAFKGLPTSGSFCIGFNFTALQDINQIVVSEQNQFGSQDLFAVDSGNSFANSDQLSICGNTCLNPCGIFQDCTTCTSNPNCGWCAESNSCEFGNAGGPLNARCPVWRYFPRLNTSRVLTTDVSYPVDPDTMTVFVAPNSVLDASFWVNFPPDFEVPLEVVLLQDVSSYFVALSYVKSQVIYLYSQLQGTYPRARLGLNSFSDVPTPSKKSDYPFKVNVPLTVDKGLIQIGLNELVLLGGSTANAQFQALSSTATSASVGWSTNSRRVVILVTLTAARLDPVYTSDKVKNDLLSQNIVPVFIAPAGIINQYSALVQSWGFGYVQVISTSNYNSIFCEISSILATIGSTAKVVLQNPGTVVSVFPQNGYSEISPLSRVAFSAVLGPGASVANLVIPGFGSIQITPTASDNPSATSQNVVLNLGSGTSQTITLAGSTPPGSSANFVIVQLPTKGTLYQRNPDGSTGALINPFNVVTDLGHSVIYVVSSNGVNGQNYDSFQFELSDTCGAPSNIAIVTISVIGVVQKPIASPTPPSLSLNENTVTNITLTGSPSILYATITQLPASGKLLLGSTAVTTSTQITSPFIVTFKPNNFFWGNDFFSFTVTNQAATSSQVIVAVTVIHVPQLPTANNLTISTPEDTPVTINLSGTAGPGETALITYTLASQPTHGTLTQLAANVYAYQPLPRYFYGSDSFTYYTNNGFGNSPIATVSITVTFVENQPQVTLLNLVANEDTLTPFYLSGQDVDNPGAPLRAFICSWNGRGTLEEINGTVIPQGSVNVTLLNNTVLFLSGLHQSGASYSSFSYGVSKPDGLASNCATATISVNPIRHNPTASPASFTVQENSAGNLTLIATDVDGTLVSFYIASLPSRGVLAQTSGTALAVGSPILDRYINGYTVTANLIYTPNVVTYGVDSFTFIVSDGVFNTTPVVATINVTLNYSPPFGIPPAPVVLAEDSNGVLITLNGGSAQTPLAGLIFSVVVLPSKGKLYQTTGNGVATTPVQPNAPTTRTVLFIPTPLTFGVDNFLFTVTDQYGVASSPPTSVSITITQVHHPPTATSQFYTTPEDVPVQFTLTGTSIDIPVSQLVFYLVTLPSRGVLQAYNNATSNFVAPNFALTTSTVLQYIPPLHASNNYPTSSNPFTSFSFVSNDGFNNATTPGTISINVTQVFYSPTATPGSFNYTTIELTPIELQLSGSTINPGDSITITVVSFGKGTLFQENPVGTLQQGVQINAGGSVNDVPTGRVVFVPGSYDGSSPYTVVNYQVSNSYGQTAFASVNIFLVPLPHGQTTFASGTEDQPVTINLVSSSQFNNVFTITAIQAGTLTLASNGSAVLQINSTISTSGNAVSVSYQGPTHSHGNFTFQYTVTSNGLTSLPVTVTVSLAFVSLPLSISAAPITLTEGVNGTVTLGVIDPNQSPTVVVTIIFLPGLADVFNVGPNNAILNQISQGGNVTSPSFLVYFGLHPFTFGADSITIQASDIGRATVTQTIPINILPVNHISTPLPPTVPFSGLDNMISFSGSLNFYNPDDFNGGEELELIQFLTVPNNNPSSPSFKGLLQYQNSNGSWITIVNNNPGLPVINPGDLKLRFVAGPRTCLNPALNLTTCDSYTPDGDFNNNYAYANFTWNICDASNCSSTTSPSITYTIFISPAPRPPMAVSLYANNVLNVYKVAPVRFSLQAIDYDCVLLINQGQSPTTCLQNLFFIIAGNGLGQNGNVVTTDGNLVISYGPNSNQAPQFNVTYSGGVVTQDFFYNPSPGVHNEIATIYYQVATNSYFSNTLATYSLVLNIQQNLAPTITAQNQAPATAVAGGAQL